MLAAGSDDTYSLEEIAEVFAAFLPGRMYRWRWTGRLLTIHDFEVDPDMMQRLVAHLRADPANSARPLPGAMPVTRFFLEDATRMLVVGHLGACGWDRVRLLDALAAPYAIFIDRGQEPRYLLLYPDGAKLDRVAVATEEELQQVLAAKPLAVVIDLDCYRAQMLKSLAHVIEIRDQKAAAFEARVRAQGRFVKVKV